MTLPEQGTGDGGFGKFSLVAAAKLVCMPACRENERARHFFLLRFRRLIFTDCAGEGENASMSLSLRRHIWYETGRERKCVGPFLGLFGRSIFTERGAGVGVYIGYLTRAVVLLVGKPAGWQGKRAGRFYLLCLHHLMFADCVGKT